MELNMLSIDWFCEKRNMLKSGKFVCVCWGEHRLNQSEERETKAEMEAIILD